jgi:nucleoside-diphosphate-sugar epimerase
MRILKKQFGWAPPKISLEEGLEKNYEWIKKQVN